MKGLGSSTPVSYSCASREGALKMTSAVATGSPARANVAATAKSSVSKNWDRSSANATRATSDDELLREATPRRVGGRLCGVRELRDHGGVGAGRAVAARQRQVEVA